MAWTGAVAVALPVLFLANQALDSWRQQVYSGFAPHGSLGGQASVLVAEITDYFSWRWSPTEAIGQLGVVSLTQSVGPGAMAAQDLSDLAFIALTWLFLDRIARSWQPSPGRFALGAAVWGASVLAAVLSGLITPDLFGAPGENVGVLLTLAGGMADRAPGGILCGAFATLVVLLTEAAAARWNPAPAAGEPDPDAAPGPTPLGNDPSSATGSEARIGPDGVAALPEPRHGGEELRANGTGRPVSSDVEFLGDFELGEAGPPGGGL